MQKTLATLILVLFSCAAAQAAAAVAPVTAVRPRSI
jgi:hypothetical protein